MSSKPISIPGTHGGNATLDEQAADLQRAIQRRLDSQIVVGSPGSAQANHDAERASLLKAAKKLANALSPYAEHHSGGLVEAIRFAEQVLDRH